MSLQSVAVKEAERPKHWLGLWSRTERLVLKTVMNPQMRSNSILVLNYYIFAHDNVETFAP